jgi:hypothetical protein
MKRRPEPRRPSSSEPPRPLSASLPALCLLLALTISLPAAWSTLRYAVNLAPLRLTFLYASPEQRARLDAALLAALERSPQTREAHALLRASLIFLKTLRRVSPEAQEAYEAEHRIARLVEPLQHTSFGQYQVLAARLLALERSGQPIESWWTSIRAILPALNGPAPHHFQQNLTEAWAGGYESLRVRPGTACVAAAGLLGHPHGPLLELLTDRLLAVARQRESGGDRGGAQLCRSLLARLLRAWILEIGPAGPRLAAAELLTRVLAEWSDSPPALTEHLRRWRETWHQAVKSRPRTVIGIRDEGALCPAEHEWAVAWTAALFWLASAAAAAALLSLILGWFWLGRGGIAVPIRSAALRGVLSASMILAAGLAWLLFAPGSVREDLRSDGSAVRYWWKLPMVAAATVFAVLLLPDRMAGKTNPAQRRARRGAAAVITWLILSAALCLGALPAARHELAMQRAIRAASADPIAAVSGPPAEALLESLREWQP